MSDLHAVALSEGTSVLREVQRILMDALGVEAEASVPEATLVNDLGAESIDFLDIAFRLEEELGVMMPMKEWAKASDDDSALTPRRLVTRLASVFRITVSEEEAKRMLEGGIEPFFREFQIGFGYALTPLEMDRLRAAADPKLGIKEFAARQIDLFTVQSLVNFVNASLSPAGKRDGRKTEARR